MGWITVLALIALMVLIGVIALALKAELKGKQAHTETRKAPRVPSRPSAPPVSSVPRAARKPTEAAQAEPRPVAAVATPTPKGKIRARVTYVKADGSRSDRVVTLYSRVVVNGVTEAVNVREEGQSVTKRFLLDGFKRLQVPPDLILDNAGAIRAWIEANISLKQDKTAAQSEPARRAAATRLQPSTPPAKVAPQLAAPSLEALLPQGAKGFAVFDLETTGLNTAECRIVEVALVCISPQGKIVEVWESLVNPEEQIPERSSEVHRIRNRDVGRAPKFEELANLFAAKIDGRVLVAHNLRFDLPILQRHFQDHSSVDVEISGGICTLKGFPGNPDRGFKKTLPDLCAVQGVAFDPALAHSALGDALPLAKALAAGIQHLKPSAEMVQVQTKLSFEAPAQVWTRGMLASLPQLGWERVTLMLMPGQVFCTTGPATRKPDTPIHRAQAHAEQLGLQYVKVSSLSKKSPPDFLLSTSLELENTKMKQARERRIPIVLIDQIHQLTALEHSVVAWLSSDV